MHSLFQIWKRRIFSLLSAAQPQGVDGTGALDEDEEGEK